MHQRAAIAELTEWWEDLHDRSTGSQVVCMGVPPGWGRTTVLDTMAALVVADASRPGSVMRLPGRDAPDGLALQVAWLRGVIEDQGYARSVHRAVGLDRAEVVTEAGLGLLGLLGLVTGLPGLAAGLPASLLFNAVGSARDRADARQFAEVARLGHAIATYSKSLPVALLVDDAEALDERLLQRLAFTILDRVASNVLIIVAADAAGWHHARRERIGSVDVDPAMDESARRRLIETTATDWPPAAVDRLAARSRTFSDIWAVLQLGAAADVPRAVSSEERRRLIDELTRHVIDPGVPTPAARALAWAGGLLHERQLDAAIAALSGPPLTGESNDPRLAHVGHAVRFPQPGYRERAARSASVLSRSETAAMAAAIREIARELCQSRDSELDVVDVVISLRPLLHLAERSELIVDAEVGELLLRLTDALERLGDAGDALHVAKSSLDLLDHRNPSTAAVSNRLAATVLRLGTACDDAAVAGRAEEWAELIEAGAIIGLEATIWTAVTLLDRPRTRPAGARLVDTVLSELDARGSELGPTGVEWRLLIAHHAGRGGYPNLAERLLAPLLDEPETQPGPTQDLAFQVLAAVTGDGLADVRLRHQVLLVAYEQLGPAPAPEVLLPIAEALGSVAYQLGDYAQALRFGHEELNARLTLFPADHRDTLTTRNNIAIRTGEVGDARGALALFKALLPDEVRVLGADHPAALTVRSNIAAYTGETGDARGALVLFKTLLPDTVRVLGPEHPDTLITRNDLAGWTGEMGDAREALAMFEALLPDRVRVLGADHPDTLITRNNIAAWTGRVGDTQEALAMFEALLPDRVRVLGADHPQTLITRNNIAAWTGRVGDTRNALAMFEELLPDMARVLGDDHPYTLITRYNIAALTGEVGDAREALALSETLLPDQVRVLGADHPSTLTTRSAIERLRGRE